MKAFTVVLPSGTRAPEYQAYVDLLKEWGIDTGKLRRVPELNSGGQLLHVWGNPGDAERFAAAIKDRTGNGHWAVREVEDGRAGEEQRPPITIRVVREKDGLNCRLSNADRERIHALFPEASVLPRIFLSESSEKALKEAVWEPWEQVAKLLTGLSDEQLRRLGGVRIVDEQSGAILWSGPEPAVGGPTGPENATIEQWIDSSTRDPANLDEVLSYLVRYTLGNGATSAVTIPHPPPSGYEAELWPWNRAGGRFLDGGHPREAAEVWAGCYLCLLSLQARFQFRTHKGMPLCNLGLAQLRGGLREHAIRAWFLGLAEDVVTDFETCWEKQNSLNLQSVDVPEALVRRFSLGINTRLVDQNLIVALPELACDFGFDPSPRSFSPQVVQDSIRLLQELVASYPYLPGAGAYTERLRACWSTLTLPGGASTGARR